jgi:hypothetical protein
MPLCSKCSNLVSQNSAFCNHCGTAVNAPLPTGSTQPQMSVIAPNNQGFFAPTPPPPYASVPPPAKGKSKVFPIILGSLAILILPFVAFNLYRHHQNQIFWESLKTRPTEITKDDFEKVCAHKDDCVGRFIVWEGTVDGDAFQDAKEFHIKSVNGRADVYTVDPLPTRLHDGDDIIFDGFLGEVNSLSPDTINTGYVRKIVATADQLAQQKKVAAEQEAQSAQLQQQKIDEDDAKAKIESEQLVMQKDADPDRCHRLARDAVKSLASAITVDEWARYFEANSFLYVNVNHEQASFETNQKILNTIFELWIANGDAKSSQLKSKVLNAVTTLTSLPMDQIAPTATDQLSDFYQKAKVYMPDGPMDACHAAQAGAN